MNCGKRSAVKELLVVLQVMVVIQRVDLPGLVRSLPLDRRPPSSYFLPFSLPFSPTRVTPVLETKPAGRDSGYTAGTWKKNIINNIMNKILVNVYYHH